MYFVEKTRSTSFFKRFDYVVFLCITALSILGLVVIESATRTMSSGERIVAVQLAGVIIGVILAIIISLIDYKFYKSLSLILYFLSIIPLVMVPFIGMGREETGSNSWLLLPGGISFQPSELAKIAFILIIAYYLEKLRDDPDKNDILKLAIFIILPIALILMQPDYGTTAVFIFIFLIMIFIWGIQFKYMLLGAGLFTAVAPLIWFFVLNGERKERIISFIFPGNDPTGAGYQVERAKMAIGSGRIFGNGIGNGIQTHQGGVPVKESDFIFTVIGEELGFIGTGIVVVLMLIILLRCLYIAANSRDAFGAYVTAGVTGMFTFHFFQNIGMNIGLMPVTGIPLPFISAGGSAVVSYFIAAGLILSISARKKVAIFE